VEILSTHASLAGYQPNANKNETHHQMFLLYKMKTFTAFFTDFYPIKAYL